MLPSAEMSNGLFALVEWTAMTGISVSHAARYGVRMGTVAMLAGGKLEAIETIAQFGRKPNPHFVTGYNICGSLAVAGWRGEHPGIACFGDRGGSVCLNSLLRTMRRD